ncbi:MAG: PepSY domain-containing protein [Runella slithyformis]|nr:MAG: PepSY domain-containing protein [Runella slithyformis]
MRVNFLSKIMKKIKQIFGQIHLWLGLVSGLVVVVVSFTGCLYVFEEEARNVFQAQYFYVENPQGVRRNLYEISATVTKHFPKETIAQIRFKAAPNAAYLYHTKSKKAISINPYTLQILGVRDLETDFFNFILDIHLNLKMGEVGEQIVKWNVLIFFVLCMSGFVIWLPKQKKFLKQALTIKWNARSWKRLNWDLHSVLGFYALAVLLIVSLTGIFWVFDSAKWLVSKAVGEEITDTKAPKPPKEVLIKAPFGGLGAAYYLAKQRHSGETQTFISNSDKADQPVRVLFRYPYSIVRKQNTLFFDKNTGKLLREDLYKNYNAYDKVMRSNYDFHTGRIPVLGIGLKIIYFLASLFAASLPITGALIWWNKRKVNKKIPQKHNYQANGKPAALTSSNASA